VHRVSSSQHEKMHIYFLGRPCPKGEEGDSSSHILTRRELLSPILSFSHLVRGGSRTGQLLLLAPPTSDEKGRRCPAAKSSPLATTRKNVFKSACRVEMLLAAVQVWTREWDDEPLLLNCSVACGIPCAAVVHGARQSDRRTRVQATASGQREPADLSSYLFAIFSGTTPITRKKEKNNRRPVRASRTPERW
jgi:hypothetical protein